MGVTCFNNMPGAHRNYVLKEAMSANQSYLETCFDQWCTRSYPEHGDHHKDQSYYRRVQAVVSEDPYIYGPLNAFRSYGELRFIQWPSTAFPFPYVEPPQRYGAELGNAQSQARTEALNKFSKGGVQNGADIGEARTTANMIASSARTLAGSYLALRQGNFPLMARRLGLSWRRVLSGKTPAEVWLAYQYGWEPLMSSIHDNAQLFHDKITLGNPLRINATRVIQQDGPVITNSDERDPWLKTEWSGKIVAKCGIKAYVNNASIKTLNDFGLINPLSISWELMPLSFVVDWFVPVGNFLEGLSSTLGLSFDTGYVATTLECTMKAQLNTVFTNLWYDSPGSLVYKDFRFWREKLNKFPMPELYGKTNPFSTKHTVSALALIRQLF